MTSNNWQRATTGNLLQGTWCHAHVVPSIPWFLITGEEAEQHDTTILDIYQNRFADSTAKQVFPERVDDEFRLKCGNIVHTAMNSDFPTCKQIILEPSEPCGSSQGVFLLNTPKTIHLFEHS